MITKENGILEVVEQFPATGRVFQEFGMGCLGCASARFETIEQGARAHGMDLEKLMAALNLAAAG